MLSRACRLHPHHLQAESAAFPVNGWVSAGIPGAPTITGVTGSDGSADIAFTLAADNVGHSVRVYYSDAATGWTALPELVGVPEEGAQKTITVGIGGGNGLPRSGNWQFKLEAGERRGQPAVSRAGWVRACMVLC